MSNIKMDRKFHYFWDIDLSEAKSRSFLWIWHPFLGNIQRIILASFIYRGVWNLCPFYSMRSRRYLEYCCPKTWKSIWFEKTISRCEVVCQSLGWFWEKIQFFNFSNCCFFICQPSLADISSSDFPFDLISSELFRIFRG